MKISQETIDNLKYFQRIGQSMKFKEGADYITIIGGDTIGVADITEVFPRDVNIYDLGEFMSLISISKEPDIDVSEDNVIQISNDDFTIRYIEGVSTNIKTLKEKPTIKSMPSIDVEFNLSHDVVKRLNTVVSTLKLPYVGFVAEGGSNIYFKGFNKNTDSSLDELNSCKIFVAENTSEFEDFTFVFSRDVLSYLVEDVKVYLSAAKLSLFDFEHRKVFVTGNAELTTF